MPTSTAAELARLIQTLQQERRQHAAALAEIDAAFTSLGIAPVPVRRRGRPPALKPTAKPAGGVRRRRGMARDGMTGEKFLLTQLAKAKLSTADVNRKWKESGRKNTANVLLGQLVKDGKLKRAEAKGVRGSVYSAA